MSVQFVDDYRAGACNIGPAEIARRRGTGHAFAALTLVGLGLLLATDAPAWWRLALAAPATISASGYLQARFRFCAYFGWFGLFNFGATGHGSATSVTDVAARRADMLKAALIGLGSGLVGMIVALAAFLL